MKNPVQQMLKAGSRMKNNPQMAQRAAQSPNKVNAIAAQMVIPEQQAMQKSKPIPYPVGSVLQQKLAQAQQAALASRMPQPSEGGIAQMAAKGGVLKFAEAGKVTRGRKTTAKKTTATPETTATPKPFDQDVPMDPMTRRMSEYSVAQNIKSRQGKKPSVSEPEKPKTRAGTSMGLPPASNYATEAKARLDKALASTTGDYKDVDGLLRDIGQLPAADRAEYAELERDLRSQRDLKSQREFIETYGESPTTKSGIEAEFDRAHQEAVQKKTRKEQLANARQIREQRKVQESNLRAPEAEIVKEVESLKGIASSAKAPVSEKLQNKRDIIADRLRRNAHPSNLTNLFLTEEEVPEALAKKFGRTQTRKHAENVYEQTKADIARNRDLDTRIQARTTRKEAAANALKTQEGRNKPKPKLDGTPRVTAESRRQQADILRENNKKSSIIGDKGQVVPRRQPATPEQKAEWDKAATARKARRAKVSSELGLPEKKGIASAASKEARDYMAGKEQPAAPKAEKPAAKPDISREEADTRLASAAAEGRSKRTAQSPATVMGDINDTAHNIITSNPEWAEKLAKAATDFNAQNPNATPSERGAYLKSIAPPEALDHLMSQLSPALEKHGLLFSKGEGGIGKPMMDAIDEAAPKTTPQDAWNEPKDFKRPAAGPSRVGDVIEGAVNKGAMGLQAYSALAPIANVALDPSKSKADVGREAKYQAVQSNPSIGIGSAVGSGIGESIDKVNEFFGRPKTNYGEALSALGAYGGRGFSGLTRDVIRGKGDESPNLTAKQTLPSVGSLVGTGVEKAKGLYGGIEKALMDERTPADREREEQLQALLAQEESSRAAPEGAPPAAQTPATQTPAGQPPAAQTPPAGQTPPGAAPAAVGKGIASSPAIKPSATATGGGASSAPATPAGETTTQAPSAEARATQDQYAGDMSEATPEGAVRKLMELQGPGYQYSPEIMGMLKDSIDERRANTALSMFAGMGAGLANRDRYAGAHDAALLANQAFTSGNEREDQAQQQFLQGIIHNDKAPYEQRKAAYEMYTKMQLASAQNEALYGRALLNSDTRRYGYDRQAESRAATQRDQYASVAAGLLKSKLAALRKSLDSGMLTDAEAANTQSDYDNTLAQMEAMMTGMSGQSPVLNGLAGGETLGQNRPITTLKM